MWYGRKREQLKEFFFFSLSVIAIPILKECPDMLYKHVTFIHNIHYRSSEMFIFFRCPINVIRTRFRKLAGSQYLEPFQNHYICWTTKRENETIYNTQKNHQKKTRRKSMYFKFIEDHQHVVKCSFEFPFII